MNDIFEIEQLFWVKTQMGIKPLDWKIFRRQKKNQLR